MRRFAISDIHGCAKSFKALLEKIDFSKEDTLYVLGDYVDRGPDSKGVIDHIWQLQEAGHTVHCLMGNHEQMLLNAIADTSHRYGLQETIDSFGVSHANLIPKPYVQWITQLDNYIELDHFILVHAGLKFKGDPLKNTEAMLWTRDWYDTIDEDWLGDRIIVHGHTPITTTEIERSIKKLKTLPVINIDAGCVFQRHGYGFLCALDLGKLTFTFQERIEEGY